jgi:hypothetical protein
MEGKNFDLRSLPVQPPQYILNLSAGLNLTTENTIIYIPILRLVVYYA